MCSRPDVSTKVCLGNIKRRLSCEHFLEDAFKHNKTHLITAQTYIDYPYVYKSEKRDVNQAAYLQFALL